MARRRKKTSRNSVFFPLAGLLAIAMWKAGDKIIAILEAILLGFLWIGIVFGGLYIVVRFLLKKKKLLQDQERWNTESQPDNSNPKPWVPADNISTSIFEQVKLDELFIKSKPAPAKPAQLTLQTLQEMDWKRYELLCQGYFSASGFNAKLTKTGADGGVDIVLQKNQPDGTVQTIYVQCKAWSNQKVGVKPLRELYGVMAADKVALGIFATSSSFTSEAESFAAGKKLRLLSGAKLLDAIAKLPQETQDSLTKAALSWDYKTPTCPSCDIKMVLRTSKKGGNVGSQFWGCSNFPRCRQNLRVKQESKPKNRYF
ncbi:MULTISPECIES: restriction endonuclease [unclassified Endozoicomonas]|uniref:restriction endonuclease n=1 Tax=unclassified Endozoicomonas TaxID=2644528 RepID=UPI003BB7F3F7